MKKGVKQRTKHLKRIDSILKGLLEYKKDKVEYIRIGEKYKDVQVDFIGYRGVIGWKKQNFV